MTDHPLPEHEAPLADLGDQLGALRLCAPDAVEGMRQALARHGQLSAVVTFEHGGLLEVLDGFKRLQAARRLGWTTLRVRRCEVDLVTAIVQIVALHVGRSLTELEEGWMVRALYRDHGMSQPAIAEHLGRHKSWVWRRLLLVEALDPEVQARLRLGLLAPRAAVALAGLPRGNQLEASEAVVRRGLTVRQTELLVGHLLECPHGAERDAVLARWTRGDMGPVSPTRPPTRVARSEADGLASDVATLHRIAGRVQARLLAAPLLAHGPTVAELLADSLGALAPVLGSLCTTIETVTTPGARVPLGKGGRAA